MEQSRGPFRTGGRFMERRRHENRKLPYEHSLLRFDIRRADDLCPFLDLPLDAVGEFLGRAADGLETERGQPLAHVRHGDDPDDLTMQPIDDLLRRSARKEDAENDL